MDKLVKFFSVIGFLMVCSSAYAWNECMIEFSVKEDPVLQCGEESALIEVEAKIISDVALNPDINCRWLYEGREQPTQRLEKIGNVCRANITVSKAELHWVRVHYWQGFGEGELITPCKTVGRLDVKPLCCTAL